jgi:hypothetical protein
MTTSKGERGEASGWPVIVVEARFRSTDRGPGACCPAAPPPIASASSK